MNTMAVETLRTWLEEQRPVTILDIRPTQEYNEPVMTTLDEIQEQGGLIRASHDAFVEHILARIPPTPPNYERIIGFNEAGILPEEDPTELEAGANRCAIS